MPVRVPIITRRLRALLFQVVTRMLLLFSRRAFPYDALLSHLCCHISVIDVQRKENAVDQVCLLRCPCSPAGVWNCKQYPFNQSQNTFPLFSVFACASLITFSLDRSSPHDPVFLVQVFLNHVLQESAAFWFILFCIVS